jgi:hypothetical protein
MKTTKFVGHKIECRLFLLRTKNQQEFLQPELLGFSSTEGE